jgi:hypothetical protein
VVRQTRDDKVKIKNAKYDFQELSRLRLVSVEVMLHAESDFDFDAGK